jgi:DedD protein
MPISDSDLYKDKIEVSLDGRQIFYLFFGGAVVACLVFVLGVMVGRRLEARGHVDKVAGTSAARDPLAALDKLADGPGAMTFPSALAGSGSGGPVAAVDREIAAMAAKRDAKPADAPKPEAVKPADPPKPEAVKPADPPKPEAAKPEVAKPAAEPKPADSPDDRPAGKPKFTLQLSAFQDEGEANAFLATVKGAGYAAYLNVAEVDGKKFYRVRLGNYPTYEDAVAVKADFESKVPKIAYVTRL